MKTPIFSSSFDSFNARNLSPLQVAKRFIPSRHFDRLVGRSNSLIIGPRGSGKTTLLKMLQPEALNNWSHKEAAHYRNRVDYVGVFIPTDVAWSKQLGLLDCDESTFVFADAAFTTHIFKAFIESAIYRLSKVAEAGPAFQCTRISRECEAAFSLFFAELVKLKLEIPSLRSIRAGLVERLNDIHIRSSKLKNNLMTSGEAYADDYLYLDFIPTLSAAVSEFNQLTDQAGVRWALLFDELEIAPKHIRKRLLDCLRSTAQELIFKLSLSPFSEELSGMDSPSSGADGQDFTAILLWYSAKSDVISFSRELADKIFSDAGFGASAAEHILNSDCDEIPVGGYEITNASVYAKGTKYHAQLIALYEQDSSFKKYIDENGISLDLIDQLDERKRAQHIRKIMPIVSHRLAFRREAVSSDNEAAGGSRTRKNPNIYSGADVIFSFCEGNPRWLIGLITSLIPDVDRESKRLSASRQAQEVHNASARLKALLRTFPAKYKSFPKDSGLLPLLDRIARNFYKSIVIDDFSPEPVCSFVIDEAVPADIVAALAVALNNGAIIHDFDNSPPLVGNLMHRRFRLSYLLAPEYKLPLQKLRERKLSAILFVHAKEGQASLFDDES